MGWSSPASYTNPLSRSKPNLAIHFLHLEQASRNLRYQFASGRMGALVDAKVRYSKAHRVPENLCVTILASLSGNAPFSRRLAFAIIFDSTVSAVHWLAFACHRNNPLSHSRTASGPSSSSSATRHCRENSSFKFSCA